MRSVFLCCIALPVFVSVTAYGQFTSKKLITKYYDYRWRETNDQHACYYSISRKTDSGWVRGDYYATQKKLQMLGLFEDDSLQVRNGVFRFYYPGDHLSSVGKYVHNKREGVFLEFFPDGSLKDSVVYSDGRRVGSSAGWFSNGNPEYEMKLDEGGNGTYLSWFDNGQPSSAGRYTASKQSGRWQYFHKNGKVSSVELYENGLLKDKQYFALDGSPVTDPSIADHDAEFPGGEKAWYRFVRNNLYFPSHLDFGKGYSGELTIMVRVDEEGKVTDATVTLPLHPDFDKVAVDAVKKSPLWKPAISHNRAVAYSFPWAFGFERNYSEY